MLPGQRGDQVIDKVQQEVEEEHVAAQALIGSGDGYLNADPSYDQALLGGKENAKKKQGPERVEILMGCVEPAEQAQQDDENPRPARYGDTIHAPRLLPNDPVKAKEQPCHA